MFSNSRLSFSIVPPLVLIGVAIGTLASGRNTEYYGINSSLLLSESSSQVLMLRAVTITIFLLSLFFIVKHQIISFLSSGKGLFLYIAFVLFFFTNYILNSVGGSVPVFRHNCLYSLLVFSAAFVTRRECTGILLIYARNTLFVFLASSVLLVAFIPEMVLQSGYSGLIQVFDFRLWGLASHANNLGPLAVFFLLLIAFVKFDNPFVTFSAVVLGLSVLVLAQSKTAYISGIAAMLVALLWRPNRAYRIGDTMSSLRSRYRILFVFCFMFCGIVILLWLLNSLGVLTEFDIGQILTGRDKIWDITIHAWLRNILFGYGPDIWGAGFSSYHGLLGVASNAHNQIIQSLGSAGLFGLFGFVAYAGSLLLCAWRSRYITNGFSLTLVTFFLMRAVSEVPFNISNILISDFFIHLIVFTFLSRYYFLYRHDENIINEV